MNRKYVFLLLALGAVVALLLHKGADSVGAAVVGFVMRALGKAEDARRQLLIPAARDALDALRRDLEENHGVKTFVGSTLRTATEQAVLVKGKASDTNQSWHLLGRAVDLYPINPDTGKPDLDGRRGELFLKMHQVAVGHGWRGIAYSDLETGRRKYLKNGNWDGGHLEFPEGMTWAQAQARAGKAIG
jgi:hypothetical protein